MLRPTATLLREALPGPSSAAQHLLAHVKRSSLTALAPSKTLYEHLASLPASGVGMRVRQRRWAAKGLDVAQGQPLAGPTKEQKQQDHLCYWQVTRVRLKLDGTHGKAWGKFVWRGESPCLLLTRWGSSLT